MTSNHQEVNLRPDDIGIISALGRLRQDECEFKASLRYICSEILSQRRRRKKREEKGKGGKEEIRRGKGHMWVGCPEGGEQESAQGRCEAGNDFQLLLINDECVSFSSF